MYRGEPAIERAGSGGGNRSAGDPRRARSPRRRRATAAADLPADADGEEEPYGEEEEEEEEEDEEEEAYIVLDLQPRRPSDSATRVYRNDDSCRCRAVQKRPGRRRRGSGNALRILFVVAAVAFLALAVSPGMKLMTDVARFLVSCARILLNLGVLKRLNGESFSPLDRSDSTISAPLSVTCLSYEKVC